MSIFISIASYRDPELPSTIRSLYDMADQPEDLVFSVVSQEVKNRHPDLSWLGKQLKMIEVHAKDAAGAGYARKLAMQNYNEEDYFLQLDSHMRVRKGWDTDLKNMLSVAQEIAGTDKVILSQFPAAYFIGSDNKVYYKDDKDYWARPSWTTVQVNKDGSWGGRRMEMQNFSKPHMSHTVLAGYLFAPGKIVKEVPYDERITFMGEEVCFAIRAYTRFWEIYAPNEMLIWHFYQRPNMPKVWNNGVRKKSWMEMEKDSHEVIKRVLLGEEQGVYGIDNFDRYLEYQKMIGINFAEFYQTDIIDQKTSLNVLIEEIDFSDTGGITGYCLQEMHNECERLVCNCNCHKGER